MGHRTIAAALAVAFALFAAAPARAHATDEVLQQIYLGPAAGTLNVEVVLTPGAMVAAGYTAGIDIDRDGTFGPAETAAHMTTVARSLSLTVDGAPVPLTVTGSSYPDRKLLAVGGSAISLYATAPLPPGAERIEFRDAYRPYQKTAVQMSVTGPAGEIIRRDRGRTLAVELAPPAQAAPAPAPAPARNPALAALREPLTSPWAFLALIAICALLGALHALTPGHGKAFLAAYLVGTKGTPRQAIALGGMITVTHTSSVLVLGVAALVAGHYVLPGVLVPAVELVAGAVVLMLGVRIVRRRWRARHDHHEHEHRRPRGWREVAAAGLSGGLVPCPEALGILILAVGLHRTAVGLAMIVAFSLGLAAVVVGLGLVLVTARDAFAGLRPARNPVLLSRLPLVSAAVVVLLGVAMTVTGMAGVVEVS
jgi:ABC-type nickel/cobalt efflux system permease component RcnA